MGICPLLTSFASQTFQPVDGKARPSRYKSLTSVAKAMGLNPDNQLARRLTKPMREDFSKRLTGNEKTLLPHVVC